MSNTVKYLPFSPMQRISAVDLSEKGFNNAGTFLMGRNRIFFLKAFDCAKDPWRRSPADRSPDLPAHRWWAFRPPLPSHPFGSHDGPQATENSKGPAWCRHRKGENRQSFGGPRSSSYRQYEAGGNKGPTSMVHICNGSQVFE